MFAQAHISATLPRAGCLTSPAELTPGAVGDYEQPDSLAVKIVNSLHGPGVGHLAVVQHPKLIQKHALRTALEIAATAKGLSRLA